MEGESHEMFKIHPNSGLVSFVEGKLDRESAPSYKLTIYAVDDGNLTTTADLIIYLEDVNDNFPTFEKEPSTSIAESRNFETDPAHLMHSRSEYFADITSEVIKIPENLRIGSMVSKVTAEDQDTGLFADIRYMIDSQTSYDFSGNLSGIPKIKRVHSFAINPTTGVITVADDIIPNNFYLLNVTAIDGGGLTSSSIVSIAVYDINDHTPRFSRNHYQFTIREGSYLVGEVGPVIAKDLDFGSNAKISYKILLNTSQEMYGEFPFRIGESSGVVLVTGEIDRESNPEYFFYVEASDNGTPPLSSTATVGISVRDFNAHAPKFYQYQSVRKPSKGKPEKSLPVYLTSVPEDVPIGSLVSYVYANDSDSLNSRNGIISYKIIDPTSAFGINSKNGRIYTLRKLDFESKPKMEVTILAEDIGSPIRTSTALLEVTVTDIVEKNTERIFKQETYEVNLDLLIFLYSHLRFFKCS